MSSSKTVRVAVTQAASVDFALEACVQKTCKIIAEAGQAGAKLVAFPENFIPGYPFWIWTRGIDNDLAKRYIKNSLKRNSPEMERICAAAEEYRIDVHLGYSENDNDSLYITQSHIGSDGKIKMTRRKIKPTHVERTLFGEGSGSSLLNVVDIPNIGKVGGLSCWEHTQPLLKYHSFTQGEQIHIAAWPPMMPGEDDQAMWNATAEGQKTMSRIYATEGSCFVIHCTGVLTQETIDLMQTQSGALYRTPGGGYSTVYAPDGRKLSSDIPPNEEGILYVDLDMDIILDAKIFLDSCGHYSRPDLLWLGVDLAEKDHVRRG
ncbi:hypothetical protein N7540_002675 [Penicillium herquei]|nr:hypothetical protein N7540_002675 [Penicillium herquei]